MKIDISQTAQRLPRVSWVQSTSESGLSRGTRRMRIYVISGAVLGALFGLGAPNGGWWVVALLGAGMAAKIARRRPEDGPYPMDDKPILVDQACTAWIERRANALYFCWALKGRRRRDSFELPLAEIAELQLGSFNEWFEHKGKLPAFESNVIVMPSADGTMFRLADHAGPRGDVARLHKILTQTFVERRDELLRRLQAEVRDQVRGPVSQEVPHSI